MLATICLLQLPERCSSARLSHRTLSAKTCPRISSRLGSGAWMPMLPHVCFLLVESDAVAVSAEKCLVDRGVAHGLLRGAWHLQTHEEADHGGIRSDGAGSGCAPA